MALSLSREESLRLSSIVEFWDKESSTLIYVCAETGRLRTIKLLRELGFHWSVWIIAHAAQGGHLNLLKWLRENGCPWEDWVIRFGAGSGLIEMVSWMRDQGLQWDTWTLITAVQMGHLELVKWLVENGCPREPAMMKWLRGSISPEILSWLKDHE